MFLVNYSFICILIKFTKILLTNSQSNISKKLIFGFPSAQTNAQKKTCIVVLKKYLYFCIVNSINHKKNIVIYIKIL